MYYQFSSLDDFNQWHEALCLELNYPEIENGRIVTKGYTGAFEYKNVWIAYIDDKYADGLTPIIYNTKEASNF